MIIKKIFHAGYEISYKEHQGLIDPVLVQRFSAVCEPFPKVKINQNYFKKKHYNFVVISHEHTDHFSFESLSIINKDATLIFPTGSKVIFFAARALGFKTVKALGPWESIQVGHFKIQNIPGDKNNFEMGMFIETPESNLINLVDCVIPARALKRLKAKIDLLICPYNPIIERDLAMVGNKISFPLSHYRKLLKQAAAVGARFVLPSACEWKVAKNSRLNSKIFPINEDVFVSDLKKIWPAFKPIPMRPGLKISLGKNGALKFKMNKDGCFSSGRARYQWKPQVEMPKFKDHSLFPRLPARSAQKLLNELKKEFLPARLAKYDFFRSRSAKTLRMQYVFYNGNKSYAFSVSIEGTRVTCADGVLKSTDIQMQYSLPAIRKALKRGLEWYAWTVGDIVRCRSTVKNYHYRIDPIMLKIYTTNTISSFVHS